MQVLLIFLFSFMSMPAYVIKGNSLIEVTQDSLTTVSDSLNLDIAKTCSDSIVIREQMIQRDLSTIKKLLIQKLRVKKSVKINVPDSTKLEVILGSKDKG